MMGDVMCATRHDNTIMHKGERVAATRAIPLLIPQEIIGQAVEAANSSKNGVLQVLPFQKVRAGVMITGDEVFHGANRG